MWPLLLACAANDIAVTEEALLQMIKDAKDHVKTMDFDISKLIENELLLEKLRWKNMITFTFSFSFSSCSGGALAVA